MKKNSLRICTYLMIFLLSLQCMLLPVSADTPDDVLGIGIGDAIEVAATILNEENEDESSENQAVNEEVPETEEEEAALEDEETDGDAASPDHLDVNLDDEETKEDSSVNAAELGITAQSAVLMEASTGTVIYEKNPDEALRPASITKIMTLILIFDAIDAGKLKLTDEVTTSAYAKSMGGSQVFLEEGEVQTVETMIKCIVIASGNDASVAMAEHLAGSETEFIRMMNERAQGLGMTNTNFEDCCGLTDSETHLTSARDVAIMSRELITKYPQISDYSTIWMETITHTTNQGTSEFGLSNTNKLLKMSTSFTTTGLKTGSTSLAKYCLSATATKDGVDLIAVVMAAPNYKVRFAEAVSMLNYGYANCKLYEDTDPGELPLLPVTDGVKDNLTCEYENTFSYLSTEGEDFTGIEKEWVYTEDIKAPIVKGDVVGTVIYRLNGEEIGRVNIIASEDISQAGFIDYLKKVWNQLLIEKNETTEQPAQRSEDEGETSSVPGESNQSGEETGESAPPETPAGIEPVETSVENKVR